MFYRAVGVDRISSIGYAVSNDGENFLRYDKPLLAGENNSEKRGLEDPRLTKINNLFYMAYAAYDGITPRLCIATSDNLKNWQKQGFAFSDWNFEKAGGIYTYFDNGTPLIRPEPTEWSKSGGIFPEKINNKFLMLFGEHMIWFAESANGLKWSGDQTPFLKPRPGDYFDNTFVEMGPPPIKTENGWLVLYHGINDKIIYRLGFLLLDLNDPRKILYRSSQPIFEPKAKYELTGTIDIAHGGRSKVIFCCGAVLMEKLLRIYYGAGDTTICLATAKLSDVLKK